MRFMRPDGSEVEVETRLRRARAERGPAQDRLLRELVFLLLYKNGFTLDEITLAVAALCEGGTSRSWIHECITRIRRDGEEWASQDVDDDD